MKLLADSHTFLWVLMQPEELSRAARAALGSSENEIFLSPVSLWEISLKYALGKMDLYGISPRDLHHAAMQSGFAFCAFDPVDAATFFELPKAGHKDPFDRMLIWQAIQNDFTLVSKDRKLRLYAEHGLKFLW